MGLIIHDAITVTSCERKDIEKAHAKAVSLFKVVSDILESAVNSYYSFFVPPDGSKEGWHESNDYDERRKIFSKWLHEMCDPPEEDADEDFNPNEMYLQWVFVRYSDQYPTYEITDHTDYKYYT